MNRLLSFFAIILLALSGSAGISSASEPCPTKRIPFGEYQVIINS